MQLTQEIITALNAKYNADKAKANANLINFFNNPVAVGEHPDIVGEADKLIDTLAHAEGKVDVLTKIVESINTKAETDAKDESSDNR